MHTKSAHECKCHFRMTKTISNGESQKVNFQCQWGFLFFLFFDLQVNYMFHWQFHFRNKIPINCLFTNWKCTYILDSRRWRWSALNMGFVVKRPSRIQGNDFLKVGQGGQAWISKRVQEFPWSVAPARIWHPRKFVHGCLTSAKSKRHCLSKVVHVSVQSYLMRNVEFYQAKSFMFYDVWTRY